MVQSAHWPVETHRSNQFRKLSGWLPRFAARFSPDLATQFYSVIVKPTNRFLNKHGGYRDRLLATDVAIVPVVCILSVSTFVKNETDSEREKRHFVNLVVEPL